MKSKMLKVLKEQYSNLGLSEEVLSSVASMVIVGLSDDADDAAIAARASESYVSDMLKTFQSNLDKARTNAKKKDDPQNKGKNKGEDVDDPDAEDADAPAWAKAMLAEQKKQNEALAARLEAIENADKTKSFDELVVRVGKELNLSGDLLGLCRSGLSPDMDETTVREKLGAAKKTLVDSGVKIEDGQQAANISEAKEKSERAEAAKWVNEHKVE